MSNLIKHANREFDLLGYPTLTREQIRSKDTDLTQAWDAAIRKAALEIITMFAKQGHSGGSASTIIQITHQLMQYKPLSPLTNDPNEWHQIDNSMLINNEPDTWQSIRNPEAFSLDGGKTFYILSQKRKYIYKVYMMIPKGRFRRWVWKNRTRFIYKKHVSLNHVS